MHSILSWRNLDFENSKEDIARKIVHQILSKCYSLNPWLRWLRDGASGATN